MPLPEPGTAWPPPSHRDALAEMAEHDAWYSGCPDRLTAVYGARTTGNTRPSNRPSQYRGGVFGAVARWYWGEPTPAGERRAKLHMPLASDIAQGSAGLLFSEAPTVTFTNKSTQDRWETLTEDLHWHARLLEAADIAAGLRGVYLRCVWDTEVADHPILDIVPANRGIPEWRWGRLMAVTLWSDLPTGTSTTVVRRHVQRYERDGAGNGVVLQALYSGTVDNLGQLIPLDQADETRGLPPVLTTNMPGLDVVYVPNMAPDRKCVGNPLGRSDYQGSEGALDALDEVWTSWMRDIRLGKARLVVPGAYLTTLGPGQGAYADLDREVYEAVNAPPTASDGITQSQFAIRVEEHARTADELTRRIIASAGYSAGTFGLGGDSGAAQTATEVTAKMGESALTRRHKALYWRAALQQVAERLLMIDQRVFKSIVDPERPVITWPDSATDSPLVVAQTVNQLHQAAAISTEVKVRMVHPDQDDAWVEEEVGRIMDEQGATTADPIELVGNIAARGELPGVDPAAATPDTEVDTDAESEPTP